MGEDTRELADRLDAVPSEERVYAVTEQLRNPAFKDTMPSQYRSYHPAYNRNPVRNIHYRHGHR